MLVVDLVADEDDQALVDVGRCAVAAAADSFQNDLRTFTATLTHMDDSDALLAFTTTTASATFLILPGFDHQHPLGSTLFS